MKFPRTLEIETRRCRLRVPSREDIPYVFSATRFEGFNDGMLWDPPTNEKELEKPLEDGRKAWEDGLAYNFTIESLESKEFIGRIGIRQEPEDKVWNIGFWTHPKHQGQGYMSESLERIIEFGFSQLDALRIVACHALWNVASEKVLKKAGMSFIRYIPEGYQKKGKWVEENLLGLSFDSWQKRKVEPVGR